jgi:uncharacterized protein DUF11
MKRITYSFGAVLITLLFLSGSALAQEGSEADVQVRTMAVTEAAGRLTVKFEVFSFNDDDARNTKALVLFPVGVKFVSSATRCGPSPAMDDGTQGFATCNVGTLGVGESRTMQIVTTVPAIATIRKTFSVFAWSQTPDLLKTNNYREATAP